jgi:ferredoxin
MSVKTLTINDKLISAREEETILQAAQDAGIHIPTLCHLEGVTDVGACRLCLVEIAGSNEPGIVPTLLDRVIPVHTVVPVDIYLPGCPPDATRIKAVLEPLLKGEKPHLEGREFIKFG